MSGQNNNLLTHQYKLFLIRFILVVHEENYFISYFKKQGSNAITFLIKLITKG